MPAPSKTTSKSTLRLNKFLANANLGSRRAVEQLILQGKIKVNGKICRELATVIDPKSDLVEFQGKRVADKVSGKLLYYTYHKPKGVIVSKSDELGRVTLFDELNLAPSVNAVGRLDKESEGLLLLTNDGEFLYQYTHPKFKIKKVYHAQVDKLLLPKVQTMLHEGLMLDGKLTCAYDVKLNFPKQQWLSLALYDGQKHEVRRLLEQCGYLVRRLVRVKHGEFELGKLKPGEYRQVTPKSTTVKKNLAI